MQELKSTVQREEEIIARQEKRFESKLAEQEKQIEALASGLQNVNARFELGKATTKVVLGNP